MARPLSQIRAGWAEFASATAWGLVTSSLSLGAIGGQIIAGRLRSPARPALLIACLAPVMTGEALALGLAAPLPVVALVTAASGTAFGLQVVIFPTAAQTAVQPGVLARVTSIDLLCSEAGQPIGYSIAGSIGQAVGAHTALTVGAVGMLVASTADALLRPLRADITEPPVPRAAA